jgi:hemerythrin-like domain-containing protein
MYPLVGAQHDHGFDQPLGLLEDCHRRIEYFLELLLKVAQEAPADELTALYREALDKALRYFREAAPRHTEDEEESLFPRLRALGIEPDVLQKLERLAGEHETADRLHQEVESLGQDWLRAGKLAPSSRERLGQALLQLSKLYRSHIALEDSELFPLAARLLDQGNLRKIGLEMARRRGLQPDAEAADPDHHEPHFGNLG